jgi:hypothetical protein
MPSGVICEGVTPDFTAISPAEIKRDAPTSM